MLVPAKSILERARKESYAVPHFNTYDLESTMAIIAGAEELRSPVIVAVSEKTIEYAGLEEISLIVRHAAIEATIPVVLHLDHGRDPQIITDSVAAGFTSIMFDGSHLPPEENLIQTAQYVVDLHLRGISVEGEVGRIGGKEDWVEGTVRLTTPAEAKHFVEATGVDVLAPALGTAHGQPIKGERIHFDILKDIGQAVSLPLALHGASNIPASDLQRAIKLGISKINIDTELRAAFTLAVKNALQQEPKLVDPRGYLMAGREAITETVKRKILEFGSVGKG